MFKLIRNGVVWLQLITKLDMNPNNRVNNTKADDQTIKLQISEEFFNHIYNVIMIKKPIELRSYTQSSPPQLRGAFFSAKSAAVPPPPPQ